MPINTQDNFKINIALPIDSRIVASGSVARNNIPFKYDGLRVFDTSDRKSYVYNSSTGQFTSADTSGTGTANTLARWSTTDSLTASNVYFLSANGFLGINTNDPKAALDVRGLSGVARLVIHSATDAVVIGQNWFYASGANQTGDSAVGSSAIRMNTSGHIDFLARIAGAAALNSTGNDLNSNLMMRIDASAGSPAGTEPRTVVYTDMLFSSRRTIPSGNNSALYLRAKNGFSTPASPDITWWYNSDTGIFHPAFHQIGFSIQGNQMMRLTSLGLIVGNPTTTSHKILIYEPSASNTFLQVTNSQTGFTSARGSFFGTDSSGNLSIWARGNGSGGLSQRVITLGTTNQIIHKFDDSSFSIYGGPIIGGAVTPADAISTNRSRCVRGYCSATQLRSATQTMFLGSLYFPNSTSLFSLEVTFTTQIGSHHKVQKQLFLGYHDGTNTTLYKDNIQGLDTLISTNGGTAPNGLVSLSTFYFGHQIYRLGSQNSESNIGNGLILFQSTTPRSIEFNIYIKAGTNVTVNSSASYTMNIIDY